MSTSSPVRTRQPRRPSRPPQAGSDRPPRDASVVARSILLVVAAVSVIATSNYFAYMIGRKQVTYEELRRQVDLVAQFIDQKRVEEEPAPVTLKQRQERLEQNASGLTGLTTSTINGKTTAVAPGERAPAIPAALFDDTAVVRPDHEVRSQPPNAITKHRDMKRRQKVSPASAAPKRAPAEPAIAAQSGQSTTATATPDVGLAGQ
jgi:hypothetical protein